MTPRHWFRPLALVFAVGLTAAACGSDDTTSTASTTAAGSSTTAAAAGSSTTAAAAGNDLSKDCPSKIVVQTDWFPEAEHGALYYLFGTDAKVDTNKKVVSGKMTLDGQTLGVDYEVRAGGPAIGSSPVEAQMYADTSITLGYASTDGQIQRYSKTPLLSVVSPLEKNPQIIMWDPQTYPDVKTLADLGTKNITINVFPGATFADVFVAQGIWKKSQIDPSYDGSPARFVSQKNIAQQGFASAEPWTYKNEVEAYKRDVAFQLLNDAGFPIYSQTLGIRPADLDKLSPCLKKLVPVFQKATVGYYKNPTATNALIVDTVKQYNTFWKYPADLATFSVAKQLELGLAGNGPDKTAGNFDDARVQQVIDAMKKAGIDFPADVTPAKLVTNQFIDPSIGF